MLRRKLQARNAAVQQIEDKSRVELEQKVATKKRKFINEEEGHELEKFVFGAEEEVLDEVNHFADSLKSPKTNKEVTEKTAKWDDEDGIVATKLPIQPKWALNKEMSDDDGSDEDLTKSTGDYLASSIDLPSDILNVKKCTDANKEHPSQAKIKAVEFYQQEQLMLTAGMDEMLSLFQIDGKFNPKIESIRFEKFPIYNAHFTRDSCQIVLGSNHKAFHVFDMMSGKVTRTCTKGLEHAPNTKNFVLSPDGKHMCLVGQFGHLHLLSVKTRELIHTFRMNGPAEAVCFNSDGETMMSHGDDGEVFIWDVKSRTCRHKFIDEGCTKGTTICISGGDQYVATGSCNGVVNIYNQSCFESKSPKPLKAIMNLTTSCTSISFNSTAEILAIASDNMERAVKLIHLPTQTVFSNFPQRNHGIHIPLALDFSPNSGYLSIGNNKGRSLLFRLRHYSAY